MLTVPSLFAEPWPIFNLPLTETWTVLRSDSLNETIWIGAEMFTRCQSVLPGAHKSLGSSFHFFDLYKTKTITKLWSSHPSCKGIVLALAATGPDSEAIVGSRVTRASFLDRRNVDLIEKVVHFVTAKGHIDVGTAIWMSVQDLGDTLPVILLAPEMCRIDRHQGKLVGSLVKNQAPVSV